MLKFIKPLSITLGLLIFVMAAGLIVGTVRLYAAGNQNAAAGESAVQETVEEETDSSEQTVEKSGDSGVAGKAIGAALAIGLAALGGTLSMGNAISKSTEGVARQPEAEDKIRTLLMLGLVFIETVVIYALIVAILIVFVM